MAQIPKEERNQIRMVAAIEHMHQFSADILNMIFKTAVQKTVREAQRGKPSKHKFDKNAKFDVPGQGNLPVDTGAMRASLISELDGGQLNLGKKSKNPSVVGYDATTAIAKVNIGVDVTFGWTVKYAEYQEFGTQNENGSIKMHGNFYMTNAVQQWPKWVNQAVAEAKIKRNLAGRGIGGINPRAPLILT